MNLKFKPAGEIIQNFDSKMSEFIYEMSSRGQHKESNKGSWLHFKIHFIMKYHQTHLVSDETLVHPLGLASPVMCGIITQNSSSGHQPSLA